MKVWMCGTGLHCIKLILGPVQVRRCEQVIADQLSWSGASDTGPVYWLELFSPVNCSSFCLDS